MRDDFYTAIEFCEKGLQFARDPISTQMIRVALGSWCAVVGRLQEAEENLREVIAFTQKFHSILIGTTAELFLGTVLIAQGRMSRGLKMIEEARKTFLKNDNRTFYALSEAILGRVYLKIVEKSQPVKPLAVLRNFGFIIKNVPFAAQKAETHYNKAIELTKNIGAKGILGMAYFDLGILHKATKKPEKARESILKAIKIMQQCEAEPFLKQAKEALQSIG